MPGCCCTCRIALVLVPFTDEARELWLDELRPSDVIKVDPVNFGNFPFALVHVLEYALEDFPVWLPKILEEGRDEVEQVQVRLQHQTLGLPRREQIVEDQLGLFWRD